MVNSKKTKYLHDYRIPLIIILISSALHLLRVNQPPAFQINGIVVLVGFVIVVSLKIFGIALILKLILDRNKITYVFPDLAMMAAVSLSPFLLLKPILDRLIGLDQISHPANLWFYLLGFMVLLLMIKSKIHLSYRQAFFIAGFAYFTFYVLLTIFYAIPI